MFLPNGSELLSFLAQANLLLYSRFAGLLVIVVGVVLVRSGVFSSRQFKLQSKGLDFALSGKPQEAEKCYRAALSLGAKLPDSDRVRLLVCLGDALLAQQRYDDAKQCLTQALELGDPTGSCQGSMCDLLLAQKTSPEKAIEMADQALQLQSRAMRNMSFGAEWAKVSNDLLEARTWARKARALLMLDQRDEARQAMDKALQIMEASKSELQQARPESTPTGKMILGNRLSRMKYLTISDTCWQIGLALLAMGDTAKAIQQFLVARDTDPMGKYRSLAQGQLDSLGYVNPNRIE
jgi:tetratricopeptide (TPR) repeat protein